MKFTETHEWVHVDGSIGTVGISEHAQNELGDIVYVELPQVGKQIKAGDEAAVLESTKAAADVYAPVSGTIISVNTQLQDKPELINQSAENEGWIYKIELTAPDELDKLKNIDQYLSQFK